MSGLFYRPGRNFESGPEHTTRRPLEPLEGVPLEPGRGSKAGLLEPVYGRLLARCFEFTIRIELAATPHRRRRTTQEEVVEAGDSISDIQAVVPIEIHRLPATGSRTAEKQPV